MPDTIAILTHEHLNLEAIPYLVRTLINSWKNNGKEVFVLGGIDEFKPADALFMHVDLTVIPDDYSSFARQYPLVINGHVTNIAKRSFSSQLVTGRHEFRGPVIIKTDFNCGGSMERRLYRRQGGMEKLFNSIRNSLPWYYRSYLSSKSYPIFASPLEVPVPVWKNRDLVVEKFTPEICGNEFCLRQWVFLGQRELSQRTFSSEPIVKSGNVTRREPDIQIPQVLRDMRKALGFDYGKFDFVLVDGKPVLLDVNKTPSFNSTDPSPKLLADIEYLASGLEDFLSLKGIGFDSEDVP